MGCTAVLSDCLEPVAKRGRWDRAPLWEVEEEGDPSTARSAPSPVLLQGAATAGALQGQCLWDIEHSQLRRPPLPPLVPRTSAPPRSARSQARSCFTPCSRSSLSGSGGRAALWGFLCAWLLLCFFVSLLFFFEYYRTPFF